MLEIRLLLGFKGDKMNYLYFLYVIPIALIIWLIIRLSKRQKEINTLKKDIDDLIKMFK